MRAGVSPRGSGGRETHWYRHTGGSAARHENGVQAQDIDHVACLHLTDRLFNTEHLHSRPSIEVLELYTSEIAVAAGEGSIRVVNTCW